MLIRVLIAHGKRIDCLRSLMTLALFQSILEKKMQSSIIYLDKLTKVAVVDCFAKMKLNA